MSQSSVLSPPVFDRDAVLDLIDGEFDQLQGLVEVFLQALPSQVVQIQDALTDGDTAVIHSVTHELKSSIRDLGGLAAYEVVHRLDMASRDCNLSAADNEFSACRDELTQFCVALSGFLAENTAGSRPERSKK